MSSIDKLLIRGIRSFSPNNEDVVVFFKPLTIIVGANGAGKTTIIECLKMACTGDYPPFARHGSFIMDPKVAGESEVKAQIKLSFTNVASKKVVVCRSYQVTEKKNQKNQTTKSEFKTIDSTLQTRNNANEVVALTHRCADLDKQIPELMGVSKAILENVIFCHQEDSNWPLEDSKALKEKFDDIFASTRYVKALESIRQFKKQQQDQIRTYDAELRVFQSHRDVAHKMRGEADENKAKIAQLQEQISELSQKMTVSQGRKDELQQACKAVQQLQNEIKELEAAKEQMLQAKARMFTDLKEILDDPDDTLDGANKHFSEVCASLTMQKQQKERKLSDLRVEMQGYQDCVTRETANLARLQGEAENFQRQVKDRDQHMVAIARRFQIPGFVQAPFANDAVSSFTDAVSRILRTRKEELAVVKRESRSEEEQLNAAISQCTVQLNSAQETLKLKEKQRDELKAQERSLRLELEQHVVNSSAIADTERSIKEQEATIARKKQEVDSSGIERQVQDLEKELNALSFERKQRADEMKLMRHQQDIVVRLDVKRAERDSKKSAYTSLFEQKRSAFERHVRGTISAESADTAFKDALREKDRELQAAETSMRGLQKTCDSLSGQIKVKEEDIGRMRARLQSAKQELQHIIQGGAVNIFFERIEDKKKALESARNELSLLREVRKLFQRFLDDGKENHECPVCMRRFNLDSEFQEFVEALQDRIDNAPRLFEGKSRVVEEEERKLRDMRQLEPVAQELRLLENENIPSALEFLRPLREEYQRVRETLAEAQESCALLAAERSQMQELQSSAEVIGRLFREHESLRRAVANEEAMLAQQSGQRTLDQVRQEHDALEEKYNELSRKRDSLRKEHQQRRDDLNTMELRLRDLRTRRLELQAQLDKKETLTQTLSNNQLKGSQLAKEISDVQGGLYPLKQKLLEQTAQRDDARAAAQRREAELQEALLTTERSLDAFNLLQKNVQMYVMANKEQQMKEAEETIAQSKRAMQKYSKETEELQESVNNLAEQLSTRLMVHRNIQDNIKYRAQCALVETQNVKISARLQEMKTVPNFDQCARKLVEEDKAFNDLLSKRSTLKGAESTYKEQLRKLQEELKSTKYRNIDEEHRRMLIKFKTTEMARNDLDKYHQALDKALMRYHAVKMEEINKIIKELWQITYRGNDIDTIEIKADEEKTGKSYNYRVVMKKHGAELDMRGRCSAGQKVLASLIIRLALSESFCLNCGILALDEPTTNLDRANMDSFAMALSNIIKARAVQRNFQLIVITHDEEFVQLLGQREYAEYYYRVFKDDNGFSQIRQQEISSM